MKKDTESISEDIKSIALCEILEEFRLTKAWKEKVKNRQSKMNKANVTLADLTQYNLESVTGQMSNESSLQKYLRHEHLYVMKGGSISNNKCLWN